MNRFKPRNTGEELAYFGAVVALVGTVASIITPDAALMGGGMGLGLWVSGLWVSLTEGTLFNANVR